MTDIGNTVKKFILGEFLPGEDPARAHRDDAAHYRRHPGLDRDDEAHRCSSRSGTGSRCRRTRPITEHLDTIA